MIRLKFLVFIIFVFFVGEGVGGLLCGGGGGDYTKKTVLACRRVFYFSERAFIFELTNTKICWLVLILLFALWIAFFIATG